MSNQEILEAAITRAIDAGWDNPIKDYTVHDGYIWGQDSESAGSSRIWVNDIIFNHDFAKALWGMKPEFVGTRYFEKGGISDTFRLPAYLYHLQNMVISPDPIAYLGEHLDD